MLKDLGGTRRSARIRVLRPGFRREHRSWPAVERSDTAGTGAPQSGAAPRQGCQRGVEPRGPTAERTGVAFRKRRRRHQIPASAAARGGGPAARSAYGAALAGAAFRLPKASRIWLSASRRARSLAWSTFCTGTHASRARHAAVAADWLTTMNTGSMRMLLNAVWLADSANVTSRFSHSPGFGTIAP